MIKSFISKRSIANVLRKLSQLVDMFSAGVAVAAAIEPIALSLTTVILVVWIIVSSVALSIWADFIEEQE